MNGDVGGAGVPPLVDRARTRLQRRTLTVLSLAAIFAGIGVAAAVTAGGLLVAQVAGSDTVAGLGQTAVVLGGAAFAVPLARRSQSHGRRNGLAAGFTVGALGAGLVVLAAVIEVVALLLVGLVLFGGAIAASLQARFAATDIASPQHMTRDLSLVMWMTAVGAVIGPNLTAPAASTAEALGLPPLAGAFLWATAGFVASAALIVAALRPDPLLMARSMAGGSAEATAQPGTTAIIAAIRSSGPAMLALISIVSAHAAMVGLMVMTPLHLGHGGASLQVVGLVISVRIVGMYAFAPVMGWLADTRGRVPVIAAGAVMLATAGLLASWVPDDSAALIGLSLFLLGLGWSACLVAGSALLTDALDLPMRPGAQGLTDLSMGLAGAAAGAVAGIVFGVWSYAVLGALIAVALVPLAAVSIATAGRQRVR